VEIFETFRQVYLAKHSISDIYPIFYKQAVVLNEIAQMSFDLSLSAKAVELARAALQKNLEMGDFPPGHGDFESFTAGRVRAYSQLARFLETSNEKAESLSLSENAVSLARMLYQTSVKEQSKNGDLLVEMLVDYVQMMPAGPDIIPVVNEIRELSMRLGFGISTDMGMMLSHQERRGAAGIENEL
jgi:hypothetical protein